MSTRLIQFSSKRRDDAIGARCAQTHVAGLVTEEPRSSIWVGHHISFLVIDQSEPLLLQYSHHNGPRVSEWQSELSSGAAAKPKKYCAIFHTLPPYIVDSF